MCGRFAFYSAAEAVTNLFGVSMPDTGIVPQFNIAPTDLAAVIRMDDQGARQLAMLRWGLVPFWAKDRKMASRMINARSETVAEKPAFRQAFKERRCVVPADGYYEWVTTVTGKQPYYMSRQDDSPMAMAGLWEYWQDDDQPLETFTILTMDAVGSVADVHHRMPVMLDDVATEHWLAGDGANPPSLRELNADQRAAELHSWAVSKHVNNARNEDAALIQPIDLSTD